MAEAETVAETVAEAVAATELVTAEAEPAKSKPLQLRHTKVVAEPECAGSLASAASLPFPPPCTVVVISRRCCCCCADLTHQRAK